MQRPRHIEFHTVQRVAPRRYRGAKVEGEGPYLRAVRAVLREKRGHGDRAPTDGERGRARARLLEQGDADAAALTERVR